MNKDAKLLIFLIVIFFLLCIVDVSLSEIFKTYFTVMFVCFVSVNIEKYETIIPLIIFYGIINDIIFSAYIGPFTLIFLITFGIYRTIKFYFPINKFLSYLLMCIVTIFLLSVRMKFYKIAIFELATFIFSIPIYYTLNFVFSNILSKRSDRI